MATPVFNPEMTMNLFQKNLSHDVEDRNNPDLLNLIGTFAYIQIVIFQVSLYAKFYIFSYNIQLIASIIACAFDPTTCSSGVP
jgi:hypothetical protein